MEKIMIFVWVAAPIICLIFCIKWWAMANDVDTIKKILQEPKYTYLKQAKEYYLLGNREEAKELLDKSLCFSILYEIELIEEVGASNRDERIIKIHDIYKKRYKDAGFEIKPVDYFLNKDSYL